MSSVTPEVPTRDLQIPFKISLISKKSRTWWTSRLSEVLTVESKGRIEKRKMNQRMLWEASIKEFWKLYRMEGTGKSWSEDFMRFENCPFVEFRNRLEKVLGLLWTLWMGFDGCPFGSIIFIAFYAIASQGYPTRHSFCQNSEVLLFIYLLVEGKQFK